MTQMFPEVPRGEALRAIPKTYDFEHEGPFPEGWERVYHTHLDPEVEANGFEVAPTWLDFETQTAQFTPVNPADPAEGIAHYAYLRTPDGRLVATWDEGRWWTPTESRMFKDVLLASHRLFEGGASPGEFGWGRDTPLDFELPE